MSNLVWLSATQIDNFRTCPRLWAWDKIAKIPRTPAQSLELGTRVHDILEAYFKEGTQPDPDKTWRFEPGSPIFYPGKIAMGMMALETPKEFHTELMFENETLTPGIKYIGKIDLHWVLGKTLFITDHKTSSDPSKWGKKWESLELDTQKLLYSVALLEDYPQVTNVVFTLNYGSTKLKYKQNYKVSRTTTRAECFSLFRENIEKVALFMADCKRRRIDPIELEPTPAACEIYGGCDHKQRCKLTTRQRIRGMTQKNSLVAKLQAKKAAQENKIADGAQVLPDPVNPPEAAETVDPVNPPEAADIEAEHDAQLADQQREVDADRALSVPAKTIPAKGKTTAASINQATKPKEETEPEKPKKRTRRTKAQIEADKAAAEQIKEEKEATPIQTENITIINNPKAAETKKELPLKVIMQVSWLQGVLYDKIEDAELSSLAHNILSDTLEHLTK